MKLKQLPSLAIIDGPSIYAASRALGWEVDYKRLRDWLESETDLLRIRYYAMDVSDTVGDTYNPVGPLMRWLSLNGYLVTTKTAALHTDATGRKRVSGSLLPEMIIEAMEARDYTQQLVWFTGLADARSAVEAVQRKGVRVVICSTIKTDEPMIGEALRAQADAYLDLHDLREVIGKPAPVARPQTAR